MMMIAIDGGRSGVAHVISPLSVLRSTDEARGFYGGERELCR